MTHYERRDIPLQYELAETFTICDAYHCSVNGSTNPNRNYLWSGTTGYEPGTTQRAVTNAAYDYNHAGYDWTGGVLRQALREDRSRARRRPEAARRGRRETAGQGPEALPQGDVPVRAGVAVLLINFDENDGYFDHTSVLRFLELWTGVREPNISTWRRTACGDLTSTFDFDRTYRQPPVDQPRAVPAPITRWHPAPPADQAMPMQEPGRRPARALPTSRRFPVRLPTAS
ncbi:alkaline phosphatase family protein [Kribbella sp. NPDC051586]|uniref:alkaline phosphatase family protein n=1 Tax=Kribbella sp. NPDC051586 TaxID=3364118 RepID=UPI0037A834C2